MTTLKEVRALFGLSGWAVVFGLLALLVLLSWCSWDAGRERREDAAIDAANAQATGRAAVAGDEADIQRSADTAAINQHGKDLSDAVSAHPDARPSDRRAALACERLRQQGARDADLPARCRSGG